MPEEKASQGVEEEPPRGSISQPPSQPPSSQDPPAQPADGNHGQGLGSSQNMQGIKIGERVLILIGIATVLVNLGIWHTYSGQLDQMRTATEASTRAANLASDSLELTQGNFDRTMQRTIDQTVAQLKSARAAVDAVSTSQEQIRMDQRAWLVPGKVGPGPPEVGKPWDVSIYFSNKGKTPARNATWFCVDELAKDESSVKWYRLSPKDFPSMISPNDERHCKIDVSNGNPVPQQDLDVLTSGALTVFFYGAGTYEDVFGRFHWFTFCQFMTKTRDIMDCKTNNDTGDGNRPPAPLGLPPNMEGAFRIPVTRPATGP
jgi:hypothetical protein